MPQNNQYEHEGAPMTLRKLIYWTEEDRKLAQKLAHKYGGSVSEVLREGVRALAREHDRIVGGEPDDEADED